jgi:hypothetical protein
MPSKEGPGPSLEANSQTFRKRRWIGGGTDFLSRPSGRPTIGEMKGFVRLLVIACVLGVLGYSAANNFWQPNIPVGGTFCPTKPYGPNGGACHSICDTSFYHFPPAKFCNHLTTGAASVLIAGGLGIVIFGLLGAAISRKEHRNLSERPAGPA